MKINKTLIVGAGMSLALIGNLSAMEMTDKMSGDAMMMKDKMSTGTMMKDKMTDDSMMKKDAMMKDEMVKSVMLSEDAAMKISKLSSKAEVVELQKILVEKGYLKMPAGAKMGFYGNLTKKAHAKMKAMMMSMVKDKMSEKMSGDAMMKKDVMVKDEMKK